MSLIILNEDDTSRLLRVLYNGPRPAHVHTLICVCGNQADLRESPRAWNGWQILPHAVCPDCIGKGRREHWVEPYPYLAEERFLRQLSEMDGRHEKTV